MPAKLNTDATCPVCNNAIIAISRITRADGTTLEFCHDLNQVPTPARYVADHVLSGDDATMEVIFNRLSWNPDPQPTKKEG
jgi:hypothetical protein